MLNKDLFLKPMNALEDYYDKQIRRRPAQDPRDPQIPDELCVACAKCGKTVFSSELEENCHVCPKCGHHLRIGVRRRLALIADPGSFEEMDAGMASVNRIDFPGYDKKLKTAALDSSEKEAVVTGIAAVGGYPCALFLMEAAFMMGSMGTTVGEKITRLFEQATRQGLPVVGFTVSGGARMQEGILSLMQMAKTSGAVKRHSDGGNLYVTVLTDPTTGGVTASFAMEGDIILAEPGALVGFAGPRVIEQTTHQKLPSGFQRAEFLLEKGFVDAVVDRREQRELLIRLLALHAPAPAEKGEAD